MSSGALSPMSSGSDACDGGWSFEEHKAFEVALAQHFNSLDRWERIAACLPNRGAQEVQAYYQQLEEDVMRIENGVVPLPNYHHLAPPPPPVAETPKREGPAGKAGPSPKKAKADPSQAGDGNKRKGVPWTEEEHKLFLMGLAKHGKGDWRSIARNFVQSRTPTQVASHAQKYFIRLNSANKKDKRRASIHDIHITSIDPPAAGGLSGFEHHTVQRAAQRVC